MRSTELAHRCKDAQFRDLFVSLVELALLPARCRLSIVPALSPKPNPHPAFRPRNPIVRVDTILIAACTAPHLFEICVCTTRAFFFHHSPGPGYAVGTFN